MSDAKHTPGPWEYQEKSDAYTHIVRASGNRFIVQLGQDTSGVSEANARLIAAAPELLEAVYHLRDCGPCGEESLSECEGGRAALAAIAKAEGTTPGGRDAD